MEIQGKINQKVIDALIDLMKNIIGVQTVNIVLNKLGNIDNKEGREIIYTFAEEAQDLLGKNGAYATLRQVGRDLAKSLMKEHPKEEWDYVLETALNNFGFAKKIEKEKDSAFICGCVFFEILDKNGFAPIQHAVCWAGWGFIEGFVKEMKGVKGIKWKERNFEEEKCKFEFIF